MPGNTLGKSVVQNNWKRSPGGFVSSEGNKAVKLSRKPPQVYIQARGEAFENSSTGMSTSSPIYCIWPPISMKVLIPSPENQKLVEAMA
jgi:hypothetical protein